MTVAVLVCVPFISHASEAVIDANRSQVVVGERFAVDIVIHSEERLNAVEGILKFPASLEVVDIRDGNSVVNFWLERPRLVGATIPFSGITPGGFTGTSSRILSVIFAPTETGTVSIDLEDLVVLYNDGFGTKVSIESSPSSVTVREGENPAFSESRRDFEPPESFTPEIASDPLLFDGKYFVAFSTQDKDSGIEHYEIREGKWGKYVIAESPYILADQSLKSDVFIKAVDKAGNEREVVIEGSAHSRWVEYILFGIIILIIGFVFLKKSWAR